MGWGWGVFLCFTEGETEVHRDGGDTGSAPASLVPQAPAPPPPSPSLPRAFAPALPAPLPAAHLENRDVVLQDQGVEAVFKDPLDPERLPGLLSPTQVMCPQHHAHRLGVPGAGGQEVIGAPAGSGAAERPRPSAGGPADPRAFAGRPHPGPAAWPARPSRGGRTGTRDGDARGHSHAVQTVRGRQHEVPRDQGGAAEVASAPLQGRHEGPRVRPGRPAPHDLRGQRGAWGQGRWRR